MTCRVFTEPREGFVAHTAASKVLLEPKAPAWLSHNLEETYPATAKLADSFEKYEHSIEPKEAAFALAFGGQTYWDFLTSKSGRTENFADAMSWVSSVGPHSVEVIASLWDWGNLGSATVVDVWHSPSPFPDVLGAFFDTINR